MSELEPFSELAHASPEVAAAIGGAWALKKLLGPSVTAIGGVFGDYTEYRLRNLLKLDESIKHRLTAGNPVGATEDSDQAVHPRIAQAVVEQASWIDDPVAHEYFAGMLVSASNRMGAETSEAYFARLAASFSAPQLRLHHLIYRTLLGVGNGVELRTKQGIDRIRIHIAATDLEKHVDLDEGTVASLVLYREGLLGEYGYDLGGSVIDAWFTSAEGAKAGPGLAFTPTSMGVMLFLRAYGYGSADLNTLARLRELPSVRSEMPVPTSVTYGPGVLIGAER